MPDSNELSRREFLARSAALAAASSLPAIAMAEESMRTRTIPGTSEELPVIGLGAVAAEAIAWGSTAEAKSRSRTRHEWRAE